MSQPLVANGSINAMDPANAKDISQLDGVSKECTAQVQHPQANQPNVRHIPIFVEGRDEPLFNKNIDTAPTTVDSPIIRPPPPINDIPQPGSIFSRVKDIPVKKVVPEFQAGNVGRAASPARTIPINVVHTQPNKSANSGQRHPPSQPSPQQPPQQQQQPQQLHPQQQDRRSQSPKPPSQPVDPITKIQNIQKEILELMDKVEKYKGGSRKDKEYIYLDEMLTQNLLKLDTIDTEGKENIKAARKEAINCINKCIQVLEAKAENVNKSQNENVSSENNAQQENASKENLVQENSSQQQQQAPNNTENSGDTGNNENKEEKPPQGQEIST